MWSPHVLLEFFRELRYSFGGAPDLHCLCYTSSLLLVLIFGLVIGFWIGSLVASLVLSPGLRALLVQVLRLAVVCISGPVHRDQVVRPDPRGRLREYRAWVWGLHIQSRPVFKLLGLTSLTQALVPGSWWRRLRVRPKRILEICLFLLSAIWWLLWF